MQALEKFLKKKTCKVRAKQVIYLTVVRRELERQKNKFKKVLDKEL
ncbi:hypothetical protein AAULH_02528 [Lactobacillus helveticus MTCC 5463]|nr:hypothetical protein AAULH_02528 [Lactobacillus helveticus MTCC 5463]